MAVVPTNDSQNTAIVTNDVNTSATKTWTEAANTWGDNPGTWNNPQDFSNDSVNTATPTNDSLS